MTKQKVSKKKNKSKGNMKMLGLLLTTIVVVVVTLFFMTVNSDATVAADSEANVTANSEPQLIAPQDYQSTYLTNNADHILIDVRTPEEFASGHIAGAINISVQELGQRLSEVPTDKDIVVYCRSGNRSAQASAILSSNGFNGIYDLGGIIAWQQAGYSIEF